MSKKLYEAFGYVDDKFLDIAEKAVQSESTTRHISLRRTLSIALAAALCVSILAITAAAAGWIPGIFKALMDRNPDDVVFEAAAQSNTEGVPEIVELPEMDFSKFTLYERYYDGQTILLGYNLDEIIPQTVIGYEPTEEIWEGIHRAIEIEMINKPEGSVHDAYANGHLADEVYEDCLKYRTEKASKYNCLSESFISMDLHFRHELSQEDYNRMWQIMEEKGYVCVVTHDVWIGDHKLVNGIDMFETYDPERNSWAGMTEYTTEAGDCIRLEPIPEAAQDRKSVTVSLNLKSGTQYHYLELGGRAVTYYQTNKDEVVNFTLENINNCG